MLDFKGKAKEASVKNTILINEATQETILMFCKESANEFYF